MQSENDILKDYYNLKFRGDFNVDFDKSENGLLENIRESFGFNRFLLSTRIEEAKTLILNKLFQIIK